MKIGLVLATTLLAATGGSSLAAKIGSDLSVFDRICSVIAIVLRAMCSRCAVVPLPLGKGQTSLLSGPLRTPIPAYILNLLLTAAALRARPTRVIRNPIDRFAMRISASLKRVEPPASHSGKGRQASYPDHFVPLSLPIS
jgi:hypothetical protein